MIKNDTKAIRFDSTLDYHTEDSSSEHHVAERDR